MRSHSSPKSIFILDRLQGLAHLLGGAILLTLVMVGLYSGEMFSRWGAVRWVDSPVLFSLGTLVLSAIAIWLLQRGRSILTQRNTVSPRHEA